MRNIRSSYLVGLFLFLPFKTFGVRWMEAGRLSTDGILCLIVHSVFIKDQCFFAVDLKKSWRDAYPCIFSITFPIYLYRPFPTITRNGHLSEIHFHLFPENSAALC